MAWTKHPEHELHELHELQDLKKYLPVFLYLLLFFSTQWAFKKRHLDEQLDNLPEAPPWWDSLHQDMASTKSYINKKWWSSPLSSINLYCIYNYWKIMKAQRVLSTLKCITTYYFCLLTSKSQPKKQKKKHRLPYATGLAPGGSSTTCQDSNPRRRIGIQLHGFKKSALSTTFGCKAFESWVSSMPSSIFVAVSNNKLILLHQRISQVFLLSAQNHSIYINCLNSLSYSPPLCKPPRYRCLQPRQHRSTKDWVTIRRA